MDIFKENFYRRTQGSVIRRPPRKTTKSTGGRKERAEEAKEEAYKQKLLNAANLKKLGVSMEIIVQAMDLSPEVIEGL